jgi:cell division protein FtsQ
MLEFRRLLLGLLVLAILATPVVAVLNGWVGGRHWPMKRLQVTAPFAFVDQEKVRAAAMPHLKDGFFAVDLKAISGKLQALHWVERVEVRKQWPDTLIVQIHEYRPLAVWNGKQMLAEQGSVFAMPKTKLPALPAFSGHPLQANDMVAFYAKAQPLFQSVGLAITELSISERNAWRIVLSDGLVLDIGRNDADIRLARFVALLPKIKREEPRRLVHADLRYTNGFALTWRALAVPAPVAPPTNPQEPA